MTTSNRQINESTMMTSSTYRLITVLFFFLPFHLFAQTEVVEYLNNGYQLVKGNDDTTYIRKYTINKENKSVGLIKEYRYSSKECIVRTSNWYKGQRDILDGVCIYFNNCGRDTELLTTYKKGVQNGVEMEYYGYRANRYYKNGLLSGKETWFYRDNGKYLPGEVRAYKKGLLDGKSISYYGNKQIRAIKKYKKGILHGKQIEYYDNGKIENIGYFKNGNPDGTWYDFYLSGDTFITHNKNGELHGLRTFILFTVEKEKCKEYYRNGVLTRAVYLDSLNRIVRLRNPIGKKVSQEKWYSGGHILRSTSATQINHGKGLYVCDTFFYKNGKIHYLSLTNKIADKKDEEGRFLHWFNNAGYPCAQDKFISSELYDSKGNLVLKTIPNQPLEIYEDPNNQGMYGIKSQNGKIITPPEYISIKTSDYKSFIVQKENSLFGIINNDGKTVAPLIYDKLESESYYTLPDYQKIKVDSSVFEKINVHYEEFNFTENTFVNSMPIGFLDSSKTIYTNCIPTSSFKFQKGLKKGIMDVKGNILFEDDSITSIEYLGFGYYSIIYHGIEDHTPYGVPNSASFGLADVKRGILTKNIKTINGFRLRRIGGKIYFIYEVVGNYDFWWLDENGKFYKKNKTYNSPDD